ncbi:MAG: hypothetical protein COA78_33835 [Blastopirellula sp.]|nr:MAG: hypothetical protein COA78_33835 [Blastopirellula sp.]
MIRLLYLSSFVFWLTLYQTCAAQSPDRRPIERAIQFLSKEVPLWQKQNKCYSCHNNGDGAKALYLAKRAGYAVEPEVLRTTSAWLKRPESWQKNGGENEFSDKKLANIQFSSALLTASEDRVALRTAARELAKIQEIAGHWEIIETRQLGSPITYGNILSTVFATEVLIKAKRDEDTDRIAKSIAWLKQQEPKNNFTAAALLLGIHRLKIENSAELNQQCLQQLRENQNQDGGWGPYAISQSENFDTAFVMMALHPFAKTEDQQMSITDGRKFLISEQLEDGSWLETTRPSGSESYAHWISTTGWVVQALLMTETADH